MPLSVNVTGRASGAELRGMDCRNLKFEGGLSAPWLALSNAMSLSGVALQRGAGAGAVLGLRKGDLALAHRLTLEVQAMAA